MVEYDQLPSNRFSGSGLVILLAGLIVATSLYFFARHAQTENVQSLLNNYNGQIASLSSQAMKERISAFEAISASITANNELTNQLNLMVAPLVERYTDLRSITWIPRTESLDNPHQQEMLQKAFSQGEATATSTIRTEDEQTSSAFYVFYPVYSKNNQLLGALQSEIDLLQLLKPNFDEENSSRFHSDFYDLSQQSKTPTINLPSERTPSNQSKQLTSDNTNFPIVDRQWLVVSHIPRDHQLPHVFPYWKAAIVTILLLTGLACIFLLRAQKRTQTLINHYNNLNREFEITQKTLQNKMIEKEVLARALNDSEQRTRDIITLSREYTFELDTDYRFAFLSPQAAEIKNLPFLSILNESIFERVDSDKVEQLKTTLSQSVKKRAEIELKLQLVDGLGERYTEVIRTVPLVDTLGEWIGFRGIGYRQIK